MLGTPELRPGRMSPTAITVSVCLHVAVLGALLYRPEPRLLNPMSSLRGDGGGSKGKVTLVAPGVSAYESPAPKKESEDKLALARPKKRREVPKATQVAVAENALRPGMPGYILGSLTSGFVNDHDVHVALPVVAPDPPIARSKLPDWLRGDVIVEITIDEEGNVTQTKVLQTIGFGLDGVIVETLYKWRFTPAIVDGMKVASRQDVHFHFPS